MTVSDTLIVDIEVYHKYFLVAAKRVSDGKVVSLEMSARTAREDDDAKRARVRSFLLRHRIVTFNGMGYDLPLLGFFVCGATNAELKRASDQIINGRVRYWEVERLLDITIPRGIDHIDLIEPQPNPVISLKGLNGRLHGRKMQDLPIEPDAQLTHDDMDLLTRYCGNDLDATHLLFDALTDPLAMRQAFREEYGVDFRSKSDAQMGEAMIRKRVEKARGERIDKVPTPPGTSFKYRVPDYISFQHPTLVRMLDRLREQEFYVQHNGKVDLPEWLAKQPIAIGTSTYAMGIGGLHSTEENRAIHSDDDAVLLDFDVASYYPAIILNSGLYPKSLGPEFLTVYRAIRDERVVAKRSGDKTKDKGLKIALNGCFGKLGSPYSVLYAPHLMIAVTLTGQLALLMLIDRAEAAGISVVSANTDGIVFRCPREEAGLPIVKDRLTGEGCLPELVEQWMADTGFDLEATEYASLYSQSVNSYIAVKPDGSTKIKGPLATPRLEGDLRGQMMKNPQMDVLTTAVVEHIVRGVALEDTIRACDDVRSFVTVVKVTGGATWRDEYLGKTVRYYWATGGEEILRKVPHTSTGIHGKVSKTDGCRPLMELPEDGRPPADVDYARYVDAACEILMDIGFVERPPVVKPLRVFKHSAVLWWAIAA